MRRGLDPFAKCWVVSDAGDHDWLSAFGAMLKSNERSPEWNPADETGGAVDGIDDPAPGARAWFVPMFLAEDRIMGMVHPDPRSKGRLDRAIGLGDWGSVGLGVDLQRLRGPVETDRTEFVQPSGQMVESSLQAVIVHVGASVRRGAWHESRSTTRQASSAWHLGSVPCRTRSR
ncbi:MAG: hypothetical protein QM519_03060 [Bacteroidia bacterium]|nr:hypothetical protein [Bacteroidia bacterium]